MCIWRAQLLPLCNIIFNSPFIFALLVLAVAVLLAELFARYYLGLGTPPLYVADPFTEYILKPNQCLRRFGNKIEVNAVSMRSPPLTATRSPDRLRVLVFGNSVVWGGAILDQSQIATELLNQAGLLEVGNVAAPGWGPRNWLGYVRRYGFLQATDVVLVVSSHHAFDYHIPTTFKGDQNMPLSGPVSALAEGIFRYLLPRLGHIVRTAHSPEASPSQRAETISSADHHAKQGLVDLLAFLQLARTSGVRVLAVQFATRQEALSGQFQPGNALIQQFLREQGIPSLQICSIFHLCGPIESLYSDDIHPYTAAGQACLARAIERSLMLNSPSVFSN